MTPIRSFKPQPTGRTIAAAGKTQENHTRCDGSWPISCSEMWKSVEKRRPAKAGLESRSYLESSDQAVLV